MCCVLSYVNLLVAENVGIRYRKPVMILLQENRQNYQWQLSDPIHSDVYLSNMMSLKSASTPDEHPTIPMLCAYLEFCGSAYLSLWIP